MSSTSACIRVKEQLLRDLSAWREPASWPTESELRERYQVSRPTISKALTALVAEGVLARIPGRRGFVVLRHAAEAPAPVLRVGHVTPADLSGSRALFPLLQQTAQGIQLVAERQGYRLLSGTSGLSLAGERAAVQDLLDAGVRGLVIAPLPRSTDEALRDYLIHEDLGVPIVLTGWIPQENPHSAAVFDNWQLGYDITSWLLAQGHARIGLVTRPQEPYYEPLRERLRGYEDAHKDQGLALDPDLVRPLPPAVRLSERTICLSSTLHTLVDRWLALTKPPTALIALEDLVAIELIELLQRRGLRVPEDITVFGFDNLELGRHFQPTFPTTQPDFLRLGELACTALLNQLASGRAIPRTYILPVPLLLRGVV